MHLVVALAFVITYLGASINTYLETQAFGKLRLGYGRLGPTEARLVLLALLVAVALGGHVALLGLSLLDLAGMAVTAALGLAIGVRAVRNLRDLARREPYAA
jgi:hypothetical protein